MKKYKFGLCLIALSVVLCFGLTACGEESGAEISPTVQPTPTAVQTPAVDPTPVASDESTQIVQPTPSQGECYTLNMNGRKLMLALEAEKLPDRDFYRVDTLKVYDGGQLLSTIDTAGLTYEGDYLFEGVFFLRGYDAWWEPTMDDFNFDGCDDLCLMASDRGPKNVPFAYFLWNDAQQRLDFSFVLSNPLTVDTENRCLVESIVGPAGSYEQRNTYQFDEQGDLVLVDAAMVYNGPLNSKVENYIEAKPAIKEPMEYLTQEQKDLLADLPVNELPRQAVDLRSLWQSQVWEQTLIPFAYDEEYDVTLYGVVSAESNFFRGGDKVRDVDADGIVLRVGDRTVYAPMPWWNNAYNQYNPWMEIGDFDGDGKPEAAICTHYGRGTGVSLEALYLFELDTLTWSTPNFTTLDIDVVYDPDDHCVALTAGTSSSVIKLESHQIPPFSCGNQVWFSYENGQLLCTIGLESYGYGIGAYAKAVSPVIWDRGLYCLGEVISLTT